MFVLVSLNFVHQTKPGRSMKRKGKRLDIIRIARMIFRHNKRNILFCLIGKADFYMRNIFDPSSLSSLASLIRSEISKFSPSWQKNHKRLVDLVNRNAGLLELKADVLSGYTG